MLQQMVFLSLATWCLHTVLVDLNIVKYQVLYSSKNFVKRSIWQDSGTCIARLNHEHWFLTYCFGSVVFSLEADIRTAKISRLSTQLRRQLHQLRRTLRSRRNRYKDLLASGSVLVKAVHSNSSACVDSLLENSKKSRKTRWEGDSLSGQNCCFVRFLYEYVATSYQ